MKKHLLIIPLALVLASCTHNKAIRQPLTGDWINARYINEIQKHKSLRSAQDYARMFSFTKGAKDTGLFVSMFHTACGVHLFPEADGYYYKANFISNKDTVEHMKFISKDTMEVNGTLFIGVSDAEETPFTFFGAPLVAEEFLFKGTYTRENGKKVEFTLNDSITGLDTLTKYSPLLDYDDEGLNLDQMVLGNNKHKNSYGFKFDEDTLCIYTLGCKVYDTAEKECAEVTYDKLLYKLRKIK